MLQSPDDNYRAVIKERIRELKKTNPKFGVVRIADYLGIRQSYLSRGLNHPKAHLNEDHFFLILDYLKFLPDEVAYLRLLRDFDLSSLPKRKEQLRIQIQAVKLSKALKVEDLKKGTLKPEESFALDPRLMVIHVALHLKPYRTNLRSLADGMAMSMTELVSYLYKLEEAGLVVLEKKLSQVKVKEVKESQVHFSREHPLMQAHQSLLREACQAKLHGLPTKSKESFMVTFSSSQRFFEKYLEAQKRFLNEIQKISQVETGESVYQLNIEFFSWL